MSNAKQKFVKQKEFRFCQTTIDNLKELVELGIVRNETEAIDLSLMHFLTEQKTDLRGESDMKLKAITNTEKSEKREGFRFCNRTVSNMESLINMGLARNKTEAIDIALEHLVTEEKTKQSLLEELRMNGSLKQVDTQPRKKS